MKKTKFCFEEYPEHTIKNEKKKIKDETNLKRIYKLIPTDCISL